MHHDISLLVSTLTPLVGRWKYAPMLLEVFSGDSYSQEQLDMSISLLQEAMHQVVDTSSREIFEICLSQSIGLRNQELKERQSDTGNIEMQMNLFFDTV